MFTQGIMNNKVRVHRNGLLPWSEELQEPSESAPIRIGLEQSLSFLSLREAVSGYPDTGESGDTYDVELTMKG